MNSPTLNEAIALALMAHAGQTDKAGAPYFRHLQRVMHGVISDDPDARIVAILHDILEDTSMTREELLKRGYSERVVNAIEALSKTADEEGTDDGYERFVRRAAANPLAKAVKISDLRDNMDLSRIAEPSEKDLNRREKYERALSILTG